MEWISSIGITLFLVILQVLGVLADDSDIVGITVSTCVSFFLLTIVIAIIVVSYQWRDWFDNWMKRRNRVRMPKAYWQKKQEAKRRLLDSTRSVSHPPSRAPSEVNGKLPAQSVDRDDNAASWVQGWSQNPNNFNNKVYEEKDVTMVLGDEQDEEFRIETVLVDNETLDVGPFKHDHSQEMAMKGEVYTEPYIYSTVDSNRKSFKSDQGIADTEFAAASTGFEPTIATTVTSETRTVDATFTTSEGEKVTNIDDMFVQL